MKKSLSLLVVATAWVMVAFTTHAQLVAPHWNPQGIPVQETTIRLLFVNQNSNSSTEVYRSTSQGSGYQLIYTAPPGGEYYEDASLAPRTTFYYKLRAIRDTLVSDFSEIQAQTTYSRFFNPSFTATAVNPLTVELSLHDLSYADLAYDIERSILGQPGSSEYIWYLEAQDSGQVHTYLDENLTPGNTYVYTVHVLVEDEGMPYYQNIAQDTVTLTLETPSFTESPGPYYENNILIGINNPNYASDTEIYRSLSPDSGYELIAGIPFEENAFYDTDLAPRTTFYYKIRAALAGAYSEFSAPRAYTSGSKYFAPGLSAEALDAHHVKLTLQDNTYDDLYYEIIRTSGPGSWSTTINAPDSGQFIVVIDSTASPNTTYSYRVDAYTKGPGNPNYPGAATATVTTPDNNTGLAVPEFSYQAPPEFFCESIINFEYWNPNTGSSTEIYRSLDSTSGFALIHTAAPGDSYFVDDVAPHTTYYYKLRAVLGDQVSAFTETRPITSLSEFYNPTIDAQAVNYGFEANWVELALTDNSYADISYGILRHEVGTDNWVGIGSRIVMSDSGQVHYFTDENVKPNTTYAYYVDVIINCDGFPQYWEVAVDTVTTLEEYLLPPSFLGYAPSIYPCGNEIAFLVGNENQGALTEIYRSRFPDSGFVLIDTMASGSDTYLDTGLESRGTYYYKLRAVKGTAVSEFSETREFEAGPTFYNPTLTLTVLPDQTVEVKLLDRTYLEYGYHIYADGGGSTFVQSVYSGGLDSGTVHTYIDRSVVPGVTYTYSVDAELYCDGLPLMTKVATASITVPDNNSPGITGFTLVDAYTDTDIRDLHDYDTIDATNRPTIRANVNDKTRSVRFFLNGKRVSTSNTDPHSLYGDAKGNYNPGKLKPGDYLFTAIPYSQRNAKGVEGTPLTIHFTVFKNNTLQLHRQDEQNTSIDAVNLYPNPLLTESLIEVSAPPSSKVKVEVMDQQGNAQATLFAGKLGSDGYWSKRIERDQLRRGTYLLAVTVNGITTIKRFVVE